LITGDYDGNSSYVTYEYQDDNYIRGDMSSANQTLIKLIVLFFVLGVVACAIWGLLRSGILDFQK